MQANKTSRNVEFDVIYADGTRHHATEGVLFEADGNKMVFHLGTSRPAVLFAVAEALVEVIKEAGLEEEFVKYIESGEEAQEKDARDRS